MKKIGAVTIGQAPRTDVMEDLAGILQGDVELIQAGALDSLTLEEVKTLRPDGTGNTLVSRMRDGTGVMLQEQKILPLMQQRIHELEEQGVSAILIMCTGEFPETFVSRVPLIYPSKVICSVVAALNNISRIGIITPEEAQIEDIRKKWSPCWKRWFRFSGIPTLKADPKRQFPCCGRRMWTWRSWTALVTAVKCAISLPGPLASR